MIRVIDRPPCFDYLPDSILSCYEFSKKDGPYMYIGFENIDRRHCSCHVDVIKWSHNIVKAIRQDWADLIDKFIKPMGVKKIVASFDDAESKTWPKFINLFGFPEPRKVLLSILEI